MDNYGYVYRTTNLINSKVYIGRRKLNRFDPSYFGRGLHIGRAIKKCGKQHFKVELIVFAFSKEELNHSEKFYIVYYRALLGWENVYNISSGGDGGNGSNGFLGHKLGCQCYYCKNTRGEMKGEKAPGFGYHRSPETRKGHSESISGEKHWNFGKNTSPETIARMKEGQRRRREREALGVS